MRCPRCLRELEDPNASCDCGSLAVAHSPRESALVAAESSALAVPQTAEARLAEGVARQFRQLVEHPKLARPLYLMKNYWPVAVIPTTAAVVAVVGVKTTISAVGTVLLWGMAIGMQLLGNM